MKERRIILASASPRRAELLRAAGFDFEVRVSPAEEPARKPAVVAVEVWPALLAYGKASAVRAAIGKKGAGAVIVGADTIVVGEGGEILNKAADRGHARRMLLGLSGKRHRVITGLCLMGGGAGGRVRVRMTYAEAVCRLKKLTERELEEYLETGLWRGKAGAYGLQDAMKDPFAVLEAGEADTVIGLPVELLKRELASFAKE
ncbi:MAG TPA: Maf family protein [Phycisphaerae bacterium]|nr:Maf family protein [Phycisphaerae bacterium]